MDVDRAALMRLFVSDSEEELGRMEAAVLVLEDRPDDAETIDALFRSAHTLKGNAAMLALDAFAKFAHTLEDLLHVVRTGQASITTELATLLLRAIDAFRVMLAALRAGEPDNPEQRKGLEAELAGWVAAVDRGAAVVSKTDSAT